MSAPYRITRPTSLGNAALLGKDTGTAKTIQTSTQVQGYLDRLMKLIPAEVIGLYLVGSGVIPATQTLALAIWALFCLVGVVLLRAYGTADKVNEKPVDWIHVVISAVAFLIWIYTIGGPFAAYNVFEPYIGSLLMLAWTFLIPIVYRGPES